MRRRILALVGTATVGFAVAAGVVAGIDARTAPNGDPTPTSVHTPRQPDDPPTEEPPPPPPPPPVGPGCPNCWT